MSAPISVSAKTLSIIEIIDKIFKKPPAEFIAKNNSPAASSVTMPLLNAPLNDDLLAGQGGADINIINDNAILPVAGPLGSIADANEKQRNGQISIYVVREGDTLSAIASMFDVSVNTIIWANDLGSARSIKPGQTLIILPVSGIQYEVKAGDTLKSIAKKFKSDANEIQQFNDLPQDSALNAGQVIIIPDAELSIPAPSAEKGSRAVKGSGGPNYLGYYLRPITGGRKTQGLHGYNGVDLATNCREPVFASASGDVIIVRSYGWNGGYGEYVVINHPNGTQTLYAHLSSIVVGQGWHVAQGQVIGYVGSTGNSTGCHVHFEVRGARNPW